MSLDWDISKVKNRESVCYVAGEGSALNPVTEAIIFTTMMVDIGKITDSNFKEFAARSQVLAEQFDAAILSVSTDQGIVRRGITVEEAMSHIGLTTNVVTRTALQWARRNAKTVERNALRRLASLKTKQGNEETP